MKKEKILAFLALFVATFFWATAYIFVKQLLESVSPYLLLSLRFTLSAVLLTIIYNKKLLKINRNILKAGIIMGIFLFGEFFTFTVGLQYTTTSRSSFLIASYIILLPLAYLMIKKKKPSLSDIIVSAVCMTGVIFILGGDLGSFHIGDIYCMACALSYAIYIVLSAGYSKLYDAGLLNVIQIAATALLSVLSLLLVRGEITEINFTGILQLTYLAVPCTIIPFFLTLYGMKYVSTTTGGVLLSFECVIAAAMGILLLHEPFSRNLFTGGTIILFSFILSEFLPDILKNKGR